MSSDYSETLYSSETQILSKADFSDKNWDLVYDGMILVGTKSYADFSSVPVTVAAKTGTTTVKKAGNGSKKEVNNGLIIALAPADNPQIAVAVVVEGATSGGSTAPVASAIMEKFFEKSQEEKEAQTEGVLLK